MFLPMTLGRLSFLNVVGFLFARQGTQRFGALKRPIDANSSCSFVLNDVRQLLLPVGDN